MEFCSKYGYNYGFEGSDSEDYEDKEDQMRLKKTRKADTNIIAVKFDKLIAQNEMFAGEPKSCKQCGAIMSYLSSKSVVKTDDQKLIWTCEFCMEANDVTNLIESLDELPKKDDVTFMIELANQTVAPSTAAAQSEDITNKEVSSDNSYLAFCIDVSSSMTTRIPSDTGEHLTRINGVKAASLETLKKLKEEEPNRRAALVTFGYEVSYYGDCTNVNGGRPLLSMGNQYNYNNSNQVQARGASTAADLYDREKMIALADNVSGDLKKVTDSYTAIEQRLRGLRTDGSTALGPALLFSVAFAAKKPGSSIILCTDGAANVGLGSIENQRDAAFEAAQKFYDDLADYAKEKSVVVNVISMEGTDCKLALLGSVADKSNGTMRMVNPANLGNEFKSLLENRMVATSVKAKLIVNHKYLYIRDEKLEEKESKAIDAVDETAKASLNATKQSVISRDIGNVHTDTEITFEYGIRKLKDEKKDTLKELPFQLQVTYTAKDGSKAMRVYTKILEFTTDRYVAETSVVDNDMLYVHNCQAMSRQMINKNTVASKHRNNSFEQYSLRNNLKPSFEFTLYSKSLTTTLKKEEVASFSDSRARDVFKNAKISRSILKKEKEEQSDAKK